MPRSAPYRRTACEAGITIVEVLVTCVVLLVGMLGVLAMLTGAVRATGASNARVGATNLARELVEGTRALDYDDLTATLLAARLQAGGLGSGSPWTIQRRGVTYTVTPSACTYDDPADKLAAAPPAAVCTPQPSAATGDANGDDFRRVGFQISWRENLSARSMTQTTLVVNPSGGLGPRILSFTPVAQTITASTAVSASVVWTTTPAESLRWAVDDGSSAASLTGSTSFETSWNIGSSGSGSEVLDGAYQLTAQPFDDLNIAGESKRANVDLNRRRPYAPPSLAGGHNTRVDDWVELEWGLNSERDVLGYRVFWAGPDDVAGNGNDVQVCPSTAADAMLAPTTTSCIDPGPPSGAAIYYVVAIDRAPDNTQRAGDRRALTIGTASARPSAPTGPLAATTVSDQPRISWNAPPSGGVSFYRIYRDGTRYDRTSTSATGFSDAAARNAGHSYAVTAVDGTFNESDLIGPVQWSP
ncbi:MAG: hypothetical protein QOJ89_3773 [bacterium]|jgi:hypothetical protein